MLPTIRILSYIQEWHFSNLDAHVQSRNFADIVIRWLKLFFLVSVHQTDGNLSTDKKLPTCENVLMDENC